MVKSRIINLKLNYCFGHNLNFGSLNGGYEFTFNINASKIVQWYE